MAFTDLKSRGEGEKKKRKCADCGVDLPKHGDECVKQAEGWKCMVCAVREFQRIRRKVLA